MSHYLGDNCPGGHRTDPTTYVNASDPGQGAPTAPQEAQEPALDEYSDDALAEIAESMKAEVRRLTQMADGAKFELERRLIERGATVLETDHWHGKLASVGYEHTVEDPARLREELLRDSGVDFEEVDRALPLPPPPVRGLDHRVLNELLKRGGQVAALINQYRRSAPKRPRLELTRKEEA